MNWNTLFSTKRLSDLNKGKEKNTDAFRNSFQRDYDRMVFSSAFRRMQNKTQVFPLPGAAFVHNRLTHSLEVASVGRSLGRVVGERIAGQYEKDTPDFQEFYKYDLANVIAAACLAHDIGNPPFGHSGEDAIRSYFRDMEGGDKEIFETLLSGNQQKDLLFFEGNSNAFRVLTHAFNGNDSAYNPTITTLAAIAKYPCCSSEGFDKKTGLISTKKSGFFDSEISSFEKIANTLELPRSEGFKQVYSRHPFVFLTEAADDICYRFIDLEDAHRLGIVPLQTIIDLFLPFFENSKSYFNKEKIQNKLDSFNDANQKVQYLRAVWIALMTQKVGDIFIERENELLAGTLQQSLLDLLPQRESDLVKAIDDYSVKFIYNYQPVVEIEIAGYHVIGEMLKTFVGAILHPDRPKSGKLLQLIPRQFTINTKDNSLYHNIQSVVDYISGMTDLYAVETFSKMTGTQIAKF